MAIAVSQANYNFCNQQQLQELHQHGCLTDLSSIFRRVITRMATSRNRPHAASFPTFIYLLLLTLAALLRHGCATQLSVNVITKCGLAPRPPASLEGSGVANNSSIVLVGSLVAIYPLANWNSEERDGALLVDYVITAGPKHIAQVDAMRRNGGQFVVTRLPHSTYQLCRLQWLIRIPLVWEVLWKEEQFVYSHIWLTPSVRAHKDNNADDGRKANSKDSIVQEDSPALVEKVSDSETDDALVDPINACNPVNCPPYARCMQLTYATQHCVCPDQCMAQFAPVCGTDGITHDNVCSMQRLSCRMNKLITSAYEGKCDPCKFFQCPFGSYCSADSLGDPHCLCPEAEKACANEEHELICGSDNENYPSMCHLTAAACTKQMQIQVQHKGGCKGRDPCASVACSYNAECRTFDGDESEGAAPASDFQISLSDGSRRMISQCSCRHMDCSFEKEDPICADDGRSFPSLCHMRRTSCLEQQFIQIRHKGACMFNPCNRVRCSQPYSVCRVDASGQANCVCLDNCPNVVLPVCGSNGKSYQSVCHLRRASCKASLLWQVKYLGNCSDASRCERRSRCAPFEICQAEPMKLPQVAPIQSSDLIAFQCRCPECFADPVVGGVGGGAGGDDSQQQQQRAMPNSPVEDQQVCGVDMITYKSHCHLLRTACEMRNSSLTKAHDGPCNACRVKQCKYYAICQLSRFGEAECICPTDCTYSPVPVCGSDGVTYENECRLKVVSCAQQREIKIISSGSCRKCPQGCPVGEECVNGRCQCRQSCPPSDMRVCGTDGKYYHNHCELRRQACLLGAEIKQDLSEASCGDSLYNADEKMDSDVCQCNVNGTFVCDTLSQKCQCKENVMGEQCDQCKTGFYGLHSEGRCLDCKCDIRGSDASLKCHPITGQCECRNSKVTGQTCDRCVDPLEQLAETGCSARKPAPARPANRVNYQNVKGIQFKPESFVELQLLGSIAEHLTVNLSFVPHNLVGTVFYLGDFSTKDHFTLLLKNAYLELHFNLGDNSVLIRSVAELALHQSYKVSAQRTDRWARLFVNDLLVGEQISNGKMRSLNVALAYAYLGRLPYRTSVTERQTRGVLTGFEGCLGAVVLETGKNTVHKYGLEGDPHGGVQDRLIRKLRHIQLVAECALFVEKKSTPWEVGNPPPPPAAVENGLRDKTVEQKPLKPEQRKQRGAAVSPSQPAGSSSACAQNNPCKYGGTCVDSSNGENIVNSAYCLCPLGRQGAYCEHEVSAIMEFTGDEFLIFGPQQLTLSNQFQISIVFLSTSSSGLLFMSSELLNAQGDYLRISLFNNMIELVCQTRLRKSVLRSDEKIQLHTWYGLTVVKGHKYVSFQVSTGSQVGQWKRSKLVHAGWKKVPSSLRSKLREFHLSRSKSYLGGYDSIEDTQNAFDYSLWFRGAVQSITVNEQVVSLKKGVFSTRKNKVSSKSGGTQWQSGPCYATISEVASPLCSPPWICVANYSTSSCQCNDEDPKSAQGCSRQKVDSDGNTWHADKKSDWQMEKPLGDRPMRVEEMQNAFASPLPAHIGRRTHGPVRFLGSQPGSKPILLNHLKVNGSRYNNIRLRFRTNALHGMQLLNLADPSSTSGDFLLLAVREGFQETAINLGGELGLLRIRSSVYVADNKWHDVQVLRSQRRLGLIVDNQLMEGELDKEASTSINTNDNIWIGGTANEVRGFPWQYQMNFDGCIAELLWNENKIEIAASNRNKNAQFDFCDDEANDETRN